MKVVRNRTPLIALSKINRLELLREVYRSIHIPEDAYTEVVVKSVGKPGATEIETADWIICQPVTDKDLVAEITENLEAALAQFQSIQTELDDND